MELGGVTGFLENMSILVTGATGFLAKILVEKILRVQPNVNKLYLLLRAEDNITALQRFQNEVIEKDLFKVLKNQLGDNLSVLLSEKVCVVPGDISQSEMGLKDLNLIKEMKSQIQIIVNLAATTNFDERYDVALGINTLGAKNVLNFAEECLNLKVLIHISTAYVSGERQGVILETPYRMGETLNGVKGLDIEIEQSVAEDKLREVKDSGATEKEITISMKELGLTRAKMYGWPNTYVFTKAMGEMVIGESKDNDIPLVIIRPTIITSTYKEPFPGWIEGIRTIDSFIVGYGKGKLQSFLYDIDSTVDVIPADLVVNTIIMTMLAQPSPNIIYHVGSSSSNPMKYMDIEQFNYKYFGEKPWINRDGKVIKVGKIAMFNSVTGFRTYMNIRYLLLLKVLGFVNSAFCHCFDDMCNDMNRNFSSVMRLVDLYRPYLFLKATFDDTNSEKLRRSTQSKDMKIKDIFFLDPKDIDWANYFINTHIPGVVKYLFK